MIKVFFNKHREILLIIAILFLGTFLRIHNLPELTSFNADQEWLAFRAKEILNKDLVLIGPVTSVGNYSIGPAFVYMWSFFSFLTGNAPIAGAYLAVFIGVVSLLFIHFFVNKFIDQKIAILTMFLVAISAPTIFWDQSPWTPSLFIIPQILMLIGAYIINKNKLGYLLISLSLVIGFQAHVGIILSFISVLIYLFFVRPVKLDSVTFLKSLGIIVLGLLPNIVFDLAHNFVNFLRLFDVIKGENLDYFTGFGKIINVLSYNAISIIYPNNKTLIDGVLIRILYALVLVNCVRNLRSKESKSISLLLLITTIFPAFVFYLQQGKFSEYYLMMTVPSSIFMVSLLLRDLINFKDKNYKFIYIKTLSIVILSLFLNLKMINNRVVDFNLKAKQDTIAEIVKMAGTDGYGISLTTKYGDQFGFKYILDYFEIKADLPPKKGETKIFSIILPEGFDGMYGMKDFNGIGLRWSGI